MRNGILNIYKECGYTSHDVVAKLRGIVKQKKIGHTGTLDPEAEGVLPVCLGKATKLCGMLTDQSKIYEAVLLLGRTTDTQDVGGRTLSVQETGYLTEEQVRACVESYVGEYEQLPPMYSARKVNGKRLYELARQGIEVERKRQRVTIHAIRMKEIALPRIRMEVHCSKGTYIRTLCHDIGADLGCGGCMESLLRTQTGPFRLEESRKLAEVEALVSAGRLEEILLPIDHVFTDLPKLTVGGRMQDLAYNGNSIPVRQTEEADGQALRELRYREGSRLADQEDRSDFVLLHRQRVRVYDGGKRLIGIFCYDAQKGLLRAEKMFLDKESMEKAGKDNCKQ